MASRRIVFIVKDQDPVQLTATETVQRACQRMWERRVGAVLVTDGSGRLVGIFTGRDAVHSLAQGKDIAGTPLALAMTPNPDTIAPERTAIDALRMMSDGGYRHLPVVEGGRILGIVSRGDFKGLELEQMEDETYLWERIC